MKELKQQNKLLKEDKIGRFKPKLLKKKLYFNLMICQKNFTFIPELNDMVENFHILTKMRDK
jgi:hypothetical protein